MCDSGCVFVWVFRVRVAYMLNVSVARVCGVCLYECVRVTVYVPHCNRVCMRGCVAYTCVYAWVCIRVSASVCVCMQVV